jgi:CRISPR system Cascade subunit CasE
MTRLYLSRVRLRDAAPVAALAGLLVGPDPDEHVARAHRLLWALFADGPARKRDFLWRDDGGAGWRRRTFLALSERPPDDRAGLFSVESKPFAPVLSPGQRLRFRLRASPSISIRAPGKRGKRKDPVAHALAGMSAAERAERRYEVLQRVGHEWLARQGQGAGFRLPEGVPFRTDGEDWRSLPRGGGGRVSFSVIDVEGVLEVVDPAAFVASLAVGFGRAKAFGCGLMLIRRA